MKKVFLVVIALVLAAGAYFYFSKSKSNFSGVNQIASGAKSLKDLIAAGVPQKCTYSSTNDSGSTQGTSYVADGKVRADFTSTLAGKSSTSHIISDNKITYMWTDGEKNGVKMTIPEGQASYSPVPESSDGSYKQADLDQKADYDCSAWIPDSSVFTPPSDVTFTDLSEMYKPTQVQQGPSGGSESSSACSYCNNLTGSDKTQCLAALNCK